MRILVGLSGGLDSTYAAYRLLEQGHSVEGLVLEMHDYTDTEAAKKTADILGIKLHTLDCRQDFKSHVISNFISEYSAGRTPNPCTVCNRYVKIARLCEFAVQNGFDKAATGHYAEIYFDEATSRYCIKKGKDEKKDQSYMLWHLTQEQLGALYFPLSNMEKEAIREAARNTPFAYLADAKESQEICFIPDNDYAKYIENERGSFPEGSFIDKNGKILGTHRGIIHYTIGQRKGLGISLGAPAYITAIDPVSNTVTVEKMSDVKSNTLIATGLNSQLLPIEDGSEYTLDVKIRYAARPMTARVCIKNGRAEATFSDSVRAVTPGQSAVFYKNDLIAFGGVIL